MDKVTVTQIKAAVETLDPDSFQPLIRKAAEDFYCEVLESCQDYLKDNAEFNIGSTIDALGRDNARLREATRQAEEQIKQLREALGKVATARMAIDGGSIAECRRIASQALEATNG